MVSGNAVWAQDKLTQSPAAPWLRHPQQVPVSRVSLPVGSLSSEHWALPSLLFGHQGPLLSHSFWLCSISLESQVLF